MLTGADGSAFRSAVIVRPATLQKLADEAGPVREQAGQLVLEAYESCPVMFAHWIRLMIEASSWPTCKAPINGYSLPPIDTKRIWFSNQLLYPSRSTLYTSADNYLHGSPDTAFPSHTH